VRFLTRPTWHRAPRPAANASRVRNGKSFSLHAGKNHQKGIDMTKFGRAIKHNGKHHAFRSVLFVSTALSALSWRDARHP